jgi:hypothetical protein
LHVPDLTTAKNMVHVRSDFVAISSFILYIDLTTRQNSSTVFHILSERVGDHANHWIKFYDSINPVSKQSSKLKTRGPTSISTATKKPAANEMEKPESLVSVPNQQKVSTGIDKNATFANYQDSCTKKGIIGQVTTAIKGESTRHTLHIIDSLQTAR